MLTDSGESAVLDTLAENSDNGPAVDEIDGLPASDFDFAHVTYVEQSGASANRFVFSENARIFERHLPSAEVNHFRAQAAMKRIQSCFAQFSSGRCCHRGFLIAETRKST